MSKAASRLTGNEAEKELIGDMKYISADQLEKDASNIRKQYADISLLVIDHITSLLMNKDVKCLKMMSTNLIKR